MILINMMHLILCNRASVWSVASAMHIGWIQLSQIRSAMTHAVDSHFIRPVSMR